MEYTTNYNLKKPSYDDKTDVADLNYNADIIDNQMKENSNAIAGKQDALSSAQLAAVNSGITTEGEQRLQHRISRKMVSKKERGCLSS